jgi:choice-of-anchor C domain-containing protein
MVSKRALRRLFAEYHEDIRFAFRSLTTLLPASTGYDAGDNRAASTYNVFGKRASPRLMPRGVGMRRRAIAAILAFICWALVDAAGAAGFHNGSFESATVNPDGSFVTLPVGNTEITGWTVVLGDIDYIGTFWQASNGTRSLDLVGDQGQGGIAQTFSTVPGAVYKVSFDLAGNPGGPPTIKPLTVSVAGVTNNYTFDITGHSNGSMGYTTHSFEFAATGTTATLQFSSNTGSDCCWGAVLDNVVVSRPTNAVPLDWAPWGALAGLLVLASLLLHRGEHRT